MKNRFLFLVILCCNFLVAQSILLPSENIVKAFDNQYPQKKPIWSMEYGKSNDDIRFVAKFKATGNTQAYAVYDSNGSFKSYKEQIASSQLPKNAMTYLDTNYPIKPNPKSKSKSKTVSVPVREAYSVVDAKNKTTYEVKVKKEGKNYSLIFDIEGNLIKTIEIG